VVRFGNSDVTTSEMRNHSLKVLIVVKEEPGSTYEYEERKVEAYTTASCVRKERRHKRGKDSGAA
jgi:hypothetical protein